MRLIIVGGQALAVALFCVSWAQAETPARLDDAKARLEAAGTLYDTGALGEDASAYTTLSIKNFAEAIAKQGGKLTGDVVAAIKVIVAPDFENLSLEMRQAYISALANDYSLAELHALQDFYHTTLGKKIAKTRSAMMTELYAAMHSVVHQDYEDAWARHQTDYRKLGLSFHGTHI